MKCPVCAGQMVKGTTVLPFELTDGRVIVVQAVPALVCEQCGESFIEMAVTRVVEQLVAAAKRDGMTLGLIRYQDAA